MSNEELEKRISTLERDVKELQRLMVVLADCLKEFDEK